MAAALAPLSYGTFGRAGYRRTLERVNDLRVAVLSQADEADYERLVAHAPASPLSHTLGYRDVLVDAGLGQALYLVVRQNGVLRAALPGFVTSHAVGRVYNSLPLVQSAGGVIFAGDASAAERDLQSAALAGALVDLAAVQSLDVCVFVGTPYCALPLQLSACAATLPRNFRVTRTTHVLSLKQPLVLAHAAREALRKASGATPQRHVATSAKEAEVVWRLYADNMRHIGVTPRPWSLYESLFRRVGPAGARFVWAEVAGQPVCGFVLLCHGDVVDYHSVGNTALGRQLQVATWLCVQELQTAVEQGRSLWNWGVSPTPAVAAWKAHFGGRDRTYDVVGFAGVGTDAWRSHSPANLAAAFPDHFVLPYDWLEQKAT